MLPILFQSHNLILYSYPLLMGLGWGVGYQVFFSLIPPTIVRWQAQILFWGIFIFAWLGAKILFLLTLSTSVSTGLLATSSFWTGGGFVFYGGLIAGFLFVLLYRLSGLTLNLATFWAIVPALTFGHALGRIGCFLAGCCYGQETGWWWGMYLHQAWRHPTQLIEALALFGLGFYLLKSRKERPRLMSHYLIFYGTIRLMVESLRGDSIRGEWAGLSPSQWISLCLISIGITVRFLKFNKLSTVFTKIIK